MSHTAEEASQLKSAIHSMNEQSQDDLAGLYERLWRRIDESRQQPGQLPLLHNEIMSKLQSLSGIISEVKGVQWKVTNYAILIMAATIAASQILNYSGVDSFVRLVFSEIALVLVGLLLVISLRMIWKTETDLKYYRAHVVLTEMIQDRICGMLSLTNSIVTEEHPELRRKPDQTSSAQENRTIFTVWFYTLIAASGAITLAIHFYLIWK
jgi:hypothetical protein